MLQDELQRFQDAERWRGVTPEQKQQQDRDRWRSWLMRYTARLGQEAAAGTSSADRVRVMNSTNPRCVQDNATVNVLPCSSHCVAVAKPCTRRHHRGPEQIQVAAQHAAPVCCLVAVLQGLRSGRSVQRPKACQRLSLTVAGTFSTIGLLSRPLRRLRRVTTARSGGFSNC